MKFLIHVNKLNKTFKNLVALSFGIFISIITAETIARLLPASDSTSIVFPIQCPENSIINIKCFHRRKPFSKLRYIKGAFPPFPIDVIKNVNDIGQFSDIDFSQYSKNNINSIPIISIGDSFVEAKQVRNDESFHGILTHSKIYQNKTKRKLNIVSTSIGAMGYSFPHYVKALEFASNKAMIQDSYVIITIISNDFETSFKEYSSIAAKGYFFFKLDSNNIIFDPYLENFRAIFKRFIVNNFALSRYIIINLEAAGIFYSKPLCFLWDACVEGKIAANIIDSEIDTDHQRYIDGYHSSDLLIYNIERLRKSSLERKKTIFIFDADRQNIYDERIPKSSYFEMQRNYLMNKLKSKGFSIIDLDNDFRRVFKTTNHKFEFINDGHWNPYAHKVVSESIIKAITKIENSINK
ncbi:hypothetical protein [Prochlorococcus marinus]|uniref:hypothetical protein n=1 Tax=Prochlorococcus marinus TaxID=1219 RepID=UPI0022B54A57|nr:hypothetical protein [Prochlorococcus marinus]